MQLASRRAAGLFDVGQRTERTGRRIQLERRSIDHTDAIDIQLDVGRVASIDPQFDLVRDRRSRRGIHGRIRRRNSRRAVLGLSQDRQVAAVDVEETVLGDRIRIGRTGPVREADVDVDRTGGPVRREADDRFQDRLGSNGKPSCDMMSMH